jgi:hypothetical protein
MKVKIILPIVLLAGVILLSLSFSSVFACDPEDQDALDSAGVMCRATSIPKPVPVATSVALALPNTLAVGTGSSPASNMTDKPLPLTCLLPEGEGATNALGVADACAWAPVQIRAVKVVPTPIPTVKANVPAAPLSQPKGDSPGAAMEMSDTWRTLEPGAMHWYRVDNGNNFYLNVWLDAYGKSGITFAMYSPDQRNVLSVDTPPKGRGAPIKNDPSHDLFWAGSQAAGVWYALVRNYNSVPVQYRINYRQATEDRICRSYWEWIGSSYVYWTACR